MTATNRGDGEGTDGPSPTRSGGYYHLIRAVIYRDLLIWLRYPVNAVLGVVVTVFFFALLFYGGQMIAGQALTDTIEGLIVGYFLWTLSQGAYMGAMRAVQSEASWGTLERHYMTPFGFGPVMAAKAVAVLLRTFLTSSVVLAVMLLMTGTALNVHALTIVVIAILGVASVLGIGLAMGGLGVLYKRISNVTSLLQFAFIGLISAPAFEIPWAALLPLAQSSTMLQQAMTDNVRLWEFEPIALAVLLGTAVGYVALGYLGFVLTTRRARSLGVLGDY
ncbi:ABC transporter permease [Halorhabdus sp. CBA1104]|uniref:ABC transporter permease n=1 Tax=Halorhabdus sp. CBA1104 TaxID=1380432 RepID=UPI0012B2BE8F|nr:ABC transporter permease [Halorhabdus sp. CBA1104]QGN07539.1 ABC transporter permease [Halorhabdus sp. CBA1104]